MSQTILYHYTTPEGLRGIIKSKTIWASDYRFLNDSSEFEYGASVFDKIFDGFRSALPSEAVEIINRLRRGGSEHCVLIASFCTKSDLLSQWRGYNGGAGYALGIDGDWLEQNAVAQDFRLAPVSYEFGEQQLAVASAFTWLKDQFASGSDSQAVLDDIRGGWWRRVLDIMAFLKNGHFQEECERRLVRIARRWPPGICTRPSSQGIIPYLPFKLTEKVIDNVRYHPQNCGMQSTVIGPAFHEHQEAALDALLASEHMRFEIRKSLIPYRSNR